MSKEPIHMKVEYYKTNIGIFIKKINMNNYTYNDFNRFKINGMEINGVVRNGFMFLEKVLSIESMEYYTSSKTILVGYLLREDTPQQFTKLLQKRYEINDVIRVWNDETDTYVFNNKEFDRVSNFYQEFYEETTSQWTSVDIEHIVLGNLYIENYNTPDKMSIKLLNNKSTIELDLTEIVSYSDIEKMCTPEFLLHTRPCSISGDQVYKIVRQYIKDNIDARYAMISSDYDTFFVVKKCIAIKPITTKIEKTKQNGKSYATPRFITRTDTHKLMTIFEMTNPSNKQKGYNIINGWKANNLEEMKIEIKIYLEHLIKVINEPVQDCPRCKGMGAICKGMGAIFTKIETNDR